MKNVLYDVKWQKLRVSLLAQNAKGAPNEGGFANVPGTQKNIEMLKSYLSDASIIGADEYALRNWRVLNLLNATRMGYSGQGKRGGTEDKLVEEFRNSLQESYDGHRVVQLDKTWDWDKVKQDLRELQATEPRWFKAIYVNVKARADNNTKRRDAEATAKNRPELLRFIDLMESVDLS